MANILGSFVKRLAIQGARYIPVTKKLTAFNVAGLFVNSLAKGIFTNPRHACLRSKIKHRKDLVQQRLTVRTQ